MRIVSLSWLLFLVIALSSCTSLVAKPVKPEIKLIGVTPLNISLTEQKLRFDLKVTNPNTFDMPIQAVDFIARINNADFASGKSNRAVTVGAKSEAVLSLEVTAGLDRLASSLGTLLRGDSRNLAYELSGTVEVSTWPRPIPFNETGAMDVKDFRQ